MALRRYWRKFKFSDLNSYNAILHIIIIIVQWNPSIMATIPCKCGHKSGVLQLLFQCCEYQGAWVAIIERVAAHQRWPLRGVPLYIASVIPLYPVNIRLWAFSVQFMVLLWIFSKYCRFSQIIWSCSYCSVILWLLIFISELLMTMHPYAWLHNVVPINAINIGYLIIL